MLRSTSVEADLLVENERVVNCHFMTNTMTYWTYSDTTHSTRLGEQLESLTRRMTETVAEAT